MTKKDVIKLVGYILLPIATLVLIFLTSCTPSHYIQSAHGGRAQGTAAYRSIYNHPYKVRDAKWYSNHCICCPLETGEPSEKYYGGVRSGKHTKSNQ